MKQSYTRFLLFLLSALSWASRSISQIPLTAPVNYSQNFDGYLGTSAASLPAGWTIGGSFSYRGQGNGSSNTGGSWAYGTGGDRSLGYLGSGSSPNINYSVSFVNNTGNVLSVLVISYDFEQWRFAGGNTNGWSVTGTGALAAVSLAGLNTTSALSGQNGTPSITPKSVTLTGLNIVPGATFGIRWACSDGPGNDNGIAIDNFQLVAPCSPSAPTSLDTTLCAGTSLIWNGNSYTTAQLITDTFTNSQGCDSIVNITLDFYPLLTHSFADTVCSGQSYPWGMQTLTATGSYTQTFSAATGCDSVVTLDLFVRPALTHSFADTVCSGQPYPWGMQTLTATGSYTQTFSAATGCDSVVTLDLFVRPALTHSFADTVCSGQPYPWGMQTLTATGSYTQTFSAATGCDSTVTLNLFARPAVTHSFADTVCSGQSYPWGMQTLTATGSYTQTFSAATGCDSTVTLNLFVRPAIVSGTAATICNGATYAFGTQLLNASGTYTEVFSAQNGCDSTVTLNLVVNPSILHSTTQHTCYGSSYPWGAQVLNASGVYTQTFTASGGCDSIVTLTFTVEPEITHTVTADICNGSGYTFGTQVLSSGGTYNQVFPAANGCDSAVTLTLTVKPAISDTTAAHICFGTQYLFGIQTISLPGVYTQVFPAADGCDSTVTLLLTASPAPVTVYIDTAACGQVLFEGHAYTASTVLQDTLWTAEGCDSVFRTVQVTVYDNVPVQQQVSVSGCGSATYEGSVFYRDTVLHQLFAGSLGCDSLDRTVTIQVRAPYRDTVHAALCRGDSYAFHGRTYTAAGTYSAAYTGSLGCDSVIVLELTVWEPPSASVSMPDAPSHCIGDKVILSASGGTAYTWKSASGTELGYNAEQAVTLYEAGNSFMVEAVDANGCRDTASVTLQAHPCCDIWLPNAFSPNNDGVNDVFKPESKGHPREYALHIFDRWGKTVFSSFNIEQGWDGTKNGQPADVATYYYRVTGKCVNGAPLDQKGSLTLVR